MASAKNKKNSVSQAALEFPSSKLTPVTDVRKNPRNVRTHSKKQIRQIARSIEERESPAKASHLRTEKRVAMRDDCICQISFSAPRTVIWRR